jgi:hypothetical protein
MKTLISAVAVALAMAAATAHAQDARNPQPSFNDSAPLYSQDVRAGTIVKEDFPKPSFVDAVELPKYSVTGNQLVDQHLPKSSFASGGPRGPATAVLQDANAPVHAVGPLPSFNG